VRIDEIRHHRSLNGSNRLSQPSRKRGDEHRGSDQRCRQQAEASVMGARRG